jgi:hypothetical protein
MLDEWGLEKITLVVGVLHDPAAEYSSQVEDVAISWP